MTDNHTLRCYALTLDPLHIGAGGYRLGRVDNTIVREPGTDLPKLPGSSISGVCRNYAIYGLKDDEKKASIACATKKEKDKTGKEIPAKDQNNCGKCQICQTFGFASHKEEIGNQIGRVKFFDGRLLAFPVRTMAGPVWVSTASLLREAGGMATQEPDDESLVVNFDLPGGATRLNLGWLYLKAEKDTALKLPEIKGLPPGIGSRLVLAPEWLYPEIVNNNLEVRTSVAISFDTGAAKSGALFTYEAVPRTALFAFDVVIDAFRCPESHSQETVKEIVESGLGLFKTLGMGGMNTRGFGRLQIITPAP
jgi:CRISPR-associated protein Cmr4